MKELLHAELAIERRIITEDREPTLKESDALWHIRRAIELLEGK